MKQTKLSGKLKPVFEKIVVGEKPIVQLELKKPMITGEVKYWKGYYG